MYSKRSSTTIVLEFKTENPGQAVYIDIGRYLVGRDGGKEDKDHVLCLVTWQKWDRCIR